MEWHIWVIILVHMGWMRITLEDVITMMLGKGHNDSTSDGEKNLNAAMVRDDNAQLPLHTHHG